MSNMLSFVRLASLFLKTYIKAKNSKSRKCWYSISSKKRGPRQADKYHSVLYILYESDYI